MKKCAWYPEDSVTQLSECMNPGFFEFLPTDLVLCEEHCRQTYDRYEAINRQMIWYLQLREKFSDN